MNAAAVGLLSGFRGDGLDGRAEAR